jgi:hypothetical protein
VSLAHLVGHYIIYAVSRGSKFDYLTYPSWLWSFLSLDYLTKKKILVITIRGFGSVFLIDFVHVEEQFQ